MATRYAQTPEAAAERVARWLDDLRAVNVERCSLVQALRQKVLAVEPGVTETVKYGGLLFSGPQAFCGIFSYAAHVSMEFSQGAAMADPAGVLEGAGKGRRHIKFRGMNDLKRCDLASYLGQAKQLGN